MGYKDLKVLDANMGKIINGLIGLLLSSASFVVVRICPSSNNVQLSLS